MDILMFGVQVMLIGLVIVFVALILLIFCVVVLGKTVRQKKPAPAAVAAPAPAPAPKPVVETGISPEIVAVITAAVAAYAPAGKSLVVRAVRRKGGWNRAAREETVYRF